MKKKIQIERCGRACEEVLMIARFFEWGDFPKATRFYLLGNDVFRRVVSDYFGVKYNKITCDDVRIGAKIAFIQIRETVNPSAFMVPYPRAQAALQLFQCFLDKESGGR